MSWCICQVNNPLWRVSVNPKDCPLHGNTQIAFLTNAALIIKAINNK